MKHTVHFSDHKLAKGGLQTVPVLHFDDNAFKRELYINRIRKFDEERAKAYGLPRLILPENLTPRFVRELMGEKLEKVADKRWGGRGYSGIAIHRTRSGI